MRSIRCAPDLVQGSAFVPQHLLEAAVDLIGTPASGSLAVADHGAASTCQKPVPRPSPSSPSIPAIGPSPCEGTTDVRLHDPKWTRYQGDRLSGIRGRLDCARSNQQLEQNANLIYHNPLCMATIRSLQLNELVRNLDKGRPSYLKVSWQHTCGHPEASSPLGAGQIQVAPMRWSGPPTAA